MTERIKRIVKRSEWPKLYSLKAILPIMIAVTSIIVIKVAVSIEIEESPQAITSSTQNQPSEIIIAAVPKYSPPQFDINEAGYPIGFAIDILDRVAALSNYKVKYQVYENWPDTYNAIQTDMADLIPNVGVVESRKTTFDFSVAIEQFPLSIFVLKTNNEIKSEETLTKKRVATIATNASIKLLADRDIQMHVFQDIEKALIALLSKKVDAFIYPSPWVKQLALSVGVYDKIQIVGKPLLVVDRAFAVKKNNLKLLDRLNTNLIEFINTEEFQRIYTKWHGKHAPLWTSTFATKFIAILIATVSLVVISFMGYWRYRLVVKLNQQLRINILEKEQVSKSLVDSEKKYRLLFEYTGVPIVQCTTKANVLLVNGSSIRTFGGKVEDYIFKPIDEVLLSNLGSIGEKVKQVLTDGVASDFEHSFLLSGAERWFHVIIQPIYNESGSVSSVQIVFHDIDQRVKTQNELIKYREHLEDLVQDRTSELEYINKELEAYSYSIAHDLRSPLRSIISFSQILMEEMIEKMSENETAYLHRVITAGLRMSQLIDDILELSKVARSEMRKERVDMTRIGKEIAEQLHTSEKQRNVDWQIQSNLNISGDPQLIEIALQNLIHNAWKFTSEVVPAKIELGARKSDKDGKLVYYIRDNGAGFDMRYSDKLFGAFQRLHTIEKYPGTGIGLATVQRIVQRHGGKVWAESEEGKGATFFFAVS